MVKSPATLIRRTWAALATVAVLASCGAPDVLAPASEEPFFYLVLNARSLSQFSSGEPTQHALLLTTGSPLDAPEYRQADRFEMHRSGQTAGFDWRRYSEAKGTAGGMDAVQLLYANYYLPLESTSDGLGVDSLVSGETYEIAITSGDRSISGKATIPAAFNARVAASGDVRYIVWPRVRGAGGYDLSFSDGTTLLQRDTVFRLSPAEGHSGAVVIRAADENLYSYLAEPNRARAGIVGAYGVFGGVSVATVVLP